MKKAIIWIFMIALCGFILGYLNTILIYHEVWNHLFRGIASIPWYLHLLLVILAFFLSILVHELGHFFTFLKLGIPVKAIYVLCLVWVKIEGKWKFKIHFKFLKLLGGIVIPDQVSIVSEEDEKDMIKKLQKVLLAGPNTSIIYGVIMFLMWLIFASTSFYVFNGFLFTINLVTCVMTILVIVSSKVSSHGLYGDYAAKKALETDQLFQLAYLVQSVTLLKDDRESMAYLYPKIVAVLERSTQLNNRLYLALFSAYLNEVIFEGQIGCTGVERKLRIIEKRLDQSEDSYLMYHQLIYFYQSRQSFEAVESLIEKRDMHGFKVDSKVKLYYEKMTNHLLNVSDESAFLNDPKNHHPNQMMWIYEPLELKHESKPIL